jgi:hypothetical protein
MEDQLLKILNVMGQVIVLDARKNLTSKQKNASYNLTNSIRYSVNNSASGLELVISMKDYGLYVIGGRGKNKTPPPIAPIVKWIKDKNLARKFLGIKGNVNPNNPNYEEQLRFIASKIAKRIGKNGITAFNFLAPTKVTFIGEKQAYLQLPKQYLKQIVDGFKDATQEKIDMATYRQLVSLM